MRPLHKWNTGKKKSVRQSFGDAQNKNSGAPKVSDTFLRETFYLCKGLPKSKHQLKVILHKAGYAPYCIFHIATGFGSCRAVSQCSWFAVSHGICELFIERTNPHWDSLRAPPEPCGIHSSFNNEERMSACRRRIQGASQSLTPGRVRDAAYEEGKKVIGLRRYQPTGRSILDMASFFFKKRCHVGTSSGIPAPTTGTPLESGDGIESHNPPYVKWRHDLITPPNPLLL